LDRRLRGLGAALEDPPLDAVRCPWMRPVYCCEPTGPCPGSAALVGAVALWRGGQPSAVLLLTVPGPAERGGLLDGRLSLGGYAHGIPPPAWPSSALRDGRTCPAAASRRWVEPTLVAALLAAAAAAGPPTAWRCPGLAPTRLRPRLTSWKRAGADRITASRFHGQITLLIPAGRADLQPPAVRRCPRAAPVAGDHEDSPRNWGKRRTPAKQALATLLRQDFEHATVYSACRQREVFPPGNVSCLSRIADSIRDTPRRLRYSGGRPRVRCPGERRSMTTSGRTHMKAKLRAF